MMTEDDYERHYSIIVEQVISILPKRQYWYIYTAIQRYKSENNFDHFFINNICRMARVDFLEGRFDSKIEELEPVK